jgi:hypothetical protein
MLPVIPTYIEALPSPEIIRADIGRLSDAIQAARKLLRVSERLHKDKPKPPVIRPEVAHAT